MARHQNLSLFPQHRAPTWGGPLTPSVIAGTNADLIDALWPIYFASLPAGAVVDVTYGRGSWWRRPFPGLVCHDLALDGVDFTDLPHPDQTFEVVCFDPPYIPAGGDLTSTAGDFQARYGITGGRTQHQLETLIAAGIAETARIVTPDGAVMVKAMDYVNGGRFTPMTHRVAAMADTAGLHLWDKVIHHAGAGPGGHNIETQVRARRAHSEMLIFTPNPAARTRRTRKEPTR